MNVSKSPRTVYFNGRIVPESAARVSIFDSALQVGDMAYEVTRTFHHRPFRLRDHLRRLRHSMSTLEIDPGLTDDELEQITLDVLRRNLPTEPADVDWNIIHDVSRGPASAYRSLFSTEELRPTVVVACLPMAEKMAALAPTYQTGLDAVVPAQRSIPRELFDPAIKVRSRAHFQLANLQASAKQRGAMALLLDPDGFATEGTSGNVFFVRGGKLQTPTARNLLPGITRDTVLELARRLNIPAGEADLTQAEVLAADEAFTTSTSIGIVHLRSIDDRTIGDGRIGPITARLRDALHQEFGLDIAAQAAAYAARLRS